MKCIDEQFESNANGTGVMTFKRFKQGITPSGKKVYIYTRTRKNGQLFAAEVFIPSVIKAGTIQKFPNGTTRIIEEDTENYPGASVFGSSAWFYNLIPGAEWKYDKLMKEDVDIDLTVDDDGTPQEPKEDAPVVTPDGEFSVGEFALKNDMDYPQASLLVKAGISNGTIKFVRAERRNAKGKPTNLYAKFGFVTDDNAVAPVFDKPVISLLIPVGEFSVKELAEQNKIDYPQASIFVKGAVATGSLVFVRAERRNVKGKPTNLYSKKA